MSDDIYDPLEPSPYKTLNVSQDATTAQVRTAHRKLILVYHPDKVQDPSEKAAKTERFQEIQQAYEILQDERRRARWDARAAARDQQMKERSRPRKASAYTPARFENIIIEERVPSFGKTYEENAFEAAFASGSSKPPKHYSTYEDIPPRKTSGRGPDMKSRTRDLNSDLNAKAQQKREKEATRSSREDAQKKRDKAKRQDKEASFSRRARVDDLDESDYEDRHYSSKSDSKSKRKNDDSKRYKDDPPRRSSRRDTRDEDSELDQKIYNVHNYIGKSRDVEPEIKRPSRARADSYTSRAQLPTPPPTPRDRDSGRRSSGDDGRRSSARARRPPSPARRNAYRNIEIVEEPSARSRGYSGTPERTLPREKTMPSRSKTSYVEPQNFPKPGLRRAETMPIHRMESSADPRRAPPPTNSKYFDVSDTSDDSSSSSSDSESEVDTRRSRKPPPSASRPALKKTSTRTSSYKVTTQPERPSVVTAEPESYDDHSRDNSPKSTHPRRTQTDRYASATNTRSPLAHSATFTGRPSPRHADSSSSRVPPSLYTTQSARGPALFGEVEREVHSPRLSSSPKSFAEHTIRSGRDTGSHSRRGSDDVRTDYSPRSRRGMDHNRRGHSYREIPAR